MCRECVFGIYHATGENSTDTTFPVMHAKPRLERMYTMTGLTTLQRRILAVLEEAGEEHFSALANTVAKPAGATSEIVAMCAALNGLVQAGLVAFATRRHVKSRRWVPLAMSDSLVLLGGLSGCVNWSDTEKIWEWNEALPRADVLLTEAGIVAARRVLSADGWPDQPLDSYE